ncbi:MAG: flippase [Candidatus Aenigmatarchaeota archaeon]
MSLKKEIAGSNVLFTTGNIIATIIAFVTSIILARFLGPEGFGLYSMAIVVTSFFIVFTDLVVGSSITRFTSFFSSQKEYGKIKNLTFLLLKYRVVITFIIAFLLAAFPTWIATNIFNKPGVEFVVLFSGIILFLNSFTEFFVAFFNGVGNFKNIIGIRIIERISKFIFPVTFIFLGLGYIGAIYGLIASGIIGILVVVIMLRKYMYIFASKKLKINKKEVYRFGFWSFVSSVTIIIFTMIDSFMITIMRSIPEIGFYRIATTWTYAITTLIPISGFVMYSYFSRKQTKESVSTIFSSSIFYSSIIIFPLAFLLSRFSGPIINVFYGDGYSASSNVLTILGFIAIPLVLGSIVSSYFSGINRPDITTKIVTISLVLNVILNYFFIINYGIVGAAIATLISLTFEIILMFAVIIHMKDAEVKYSHLYKPLIASGVVYYIFGFIYVSGLIELIVYGILSMVVYFLIMIGIKGIKKTEIEEVRTFLYNIKFKFFRGKQSDRQEYTKL